MSTDKRGILILGGGTMQLPAIVAAREMGLAVYVADADTETPGRQLADRFLHIDLKDKEGLAEAAASLLPEGLAGVFTAGTDFSTSVAYIAKRCSLPGVSYETACDARDKGRMRERFLHKGIPSPEFLCVEKKELSRVISGKIVTREGRALRYPLVVKPADNMGARGVRQVRSGEELKEAAEKALAHTCSGRVVLEEYLPGPELSIDALVYRGEVKICGIADRIIRFLPFFVEMGHTMPTDLDEAVISAAADCFIRGVRALGIDNGAAKGDIKIVDGIPFIGEIAARLSGGYMSGWTYPYASGAEVTAGAIRVALGDPPGRIEACRDWTSAERAFISIPGQVANIEGVRAARQVPYVKDLFLRTGAGSTVVFPRNNVEKCGNVITQGPDRDTAAGAAEDAVRRIFIRLEPDTNETFRFLRAEDWAWAPPAYELADERNRRAVGSMPAYAVVRKGDGLFFPIPAPEAESCRDWHGMELSSALSAVREKTAGIGNLPVKLGKLFWSAFLRGGVQGAVFILETCKRYIETGRYVDTLVERVEK